VKLPWKEVARETARSARAKSWRVRACRVPRLRLRRVLTQPLCHAAFARCRSYTKGFSQMGALYSGSECVVEKARAGALARFAAPANAALTLRCVCLRAAARAARQRQQRLRRLLHRRLPGAHRCAARPLLALATPRKTLTHARIRLAAGWQGALGGCATFAAFSVLMDKLLDH
jgi:hypothetical protein